MLFHLCRHIIPGYVFFQLRLFLKQSQWNAGWCSFCHDTRLSGTNVKIHPSWVRLMKQDTFRWVHTNVGGAVQHCHCCTFCIALVAGFLSFIPAIHSASNIKIQGKERWMWLWSLRLLPLLTWCEGKGEPKILNPEGSPLRSFYSIPLSPMAAKVGESNHVQILALI